MKEGGKEKGKGEKEGRMKSWEEAMRSMNRDELCLFF